MDRATKTKECIRMTKLMDGMIEARNPWFPEMSAKATYKRKPAPWVIDRNRASAAQKEVWKSLTRLADESIVKFPADGKFSTLKDRVKWIGSQLVGKAFAKVVKVPISALDTHPLVVKAAARGQTAQRRVHAHKMAA